MFKSLLNWLGLSSNKKQELNDDLDEKIRLSIEQFNNRPIYKTLTVEIINATDDNDLIQLVFDNLSENLPEDHEKELETVLTFTNAQQAIYVIWCFEAELNNGGFNQYYANPSGQFAKLTPDALKLVGAQQFSDLVTNANSTYKAEYLKITRYQDDTLEGFSKSYEDNVFDELDTKFYEISEIEDLRQLQIDFIRNNIADFIGN